MKKYQVTIGYKSVVVVTVKASDEKEAKEIAIKKFTKNRDKIYGNGVELQDDSFAADGIVNLDNTWDMLYK